MPKTTHDVIVIGAGVTGLTAAQQCLAHGWSTAIVESAMFGGLVTNVNQLDGEVAGSGADLAAQLAAGAMDAGAQYLSATVLAIRNQGGGFVVSTDAAEHGARAVIIASGARLKKLGVPGEDRFEGRGLSHCADCDGPLFRDQQVAVVGGGDSALQSALVLAKICHKVHLITRGDTLTAAPHLRESVMACANIAIRWRTEVRALVGEAALEAVHVAQVDTAMVTQQACTGLFVFIGLEPASEFALALDQDANGDLTTDQGLQTNWQGVFAAGAVRANYRGLLVDAIAEGRAAAKSASEYLRRR